MRVWSPSNVSVSGESTVKECRPSSRVAADVTPDDVAELGREVEWRAVHVERAPSGARHGEKIVHEAVHAVHLTLDRLEVARERFEIHRGAALLRALERPSCSCASAFRGVSGVRSS